MGSPGTMRPREKGNKRDSQQEEWEPYKPTDYIDPHIHSVVILTSVMPALEKIAAVSGSNPGAG